MKRCDCASCQARDNQRFNRIVTSGFGSQERVRLAVLEARVATVTAPQPDALREPVGTYGPAPTWDGEPPELFATEDDS